MSTASLPSYLAPLLNRPQERPPSYSPARQGRLTLLDQLGPQVPGAFVKQSRGGNTFIRLSAQENDASLPIYGSGALVQGTVELTDTEGVKSVEVKIKGKLHMKEVAEGGSATVRLCLETAVLWSKDLNNVDCPTSLHFSFQLPTTYNHDEKTYPLPPTLNVKLSGIPGFTAAVEYSVNAITSKDNRLPQINSKALGLHIGSVVVSTPFVYYPRSRPSRGIPFPLMPSINGFEITPEWQVLESNLRSKKTVRPDVVVKLYTPALGVFCITQPIPFYMTLESSPVSLAAFLPFSPTTGTSGPRKVMQVQLKRQITVDVRNTTILGVKTDMWRVDQIGEGHFTLVANDDKRISYAGEITIDPAVKIPGFKAPGFSINDFILFTVSPLDPAKSPFQDIREVIPVYLSTEPFEDNTVGNSESSPTYKSSHDML